MTKKRFQIKTESTKFGGIFGKNFISLVDCKINLNSIWAKKSAVLLNYIGTGRC